ncbi:hypothetical protein IGI04_011304 [Brassica rapa subsp. trilocularis]|uniref:Uncharacterized protein n=1 Tax=Brassica rapa subsp. trilocularis TaxID=1813537 RepID=A0ABQ7N2M9_BRACM|nr:hypothetical protein IGI04_011304 [Brassica rapa subsp. trilocularis]
MVSYILVNNYNSNKSIDNYHENSSDTNPALMNQCLDNDNSEGLYIERLNHYFSTINLSNDSTIFVNPYNAILENSQFKPDQCWSMFKNSFTGFHITLKIKYLTNCHIFDIDKV